MNKTLKLENIGSIITADHQGVNYLNYDSLVIENDTISSFGGGEESITIDCKNRLVTAGFVDSHTHPIFLNKRAKEHQMRLLGKSYEDIALSGGGIVSSIDGVRNSSEDDLFKKAYKRMDGFISHGTTTIEGKSGYGLNLESELKSLAVINRLNKSHSIDIIPTFMGAHAFPPEFLNDNNGYVDLLCDKIIPKISEQGIAEFNDVFCEKGYFSLKQAARIIKAGEKHGLKSRIHADEFIDSKTASLAAKLNTVSADHLMHVSDKGIEDLAKSNVVATLLPGTTFFLNSSVYAPARKLISGGVKVALATDFNPGSCFIQSMPFIITLACMNMQMTIEEAFQAATFNGALALGKENEIGSIEIGKKADLIIWSIDNLSEIPYHVFNPPINKIIKNGKIVFRA